MKRSSGFIEEGYLDELKKDILIKGYPDEMERNETRNGRAYGQTGSL